MKIRWLLSVLVVVSCGRGLAQEVQQPGPEHQKLMEMVGTWDAVVSMPGSPDATAVAEYRMVLNGMWLASDFESNLGGTPFRGKGFDSWDSARQVYTSVWMDSTTGTPMVFEGTYDASGRTLVMHAQSAGADGAPVKFKSTSRNIDADHHQFKMCMVGADGAETEMMSINYTRRKAQPASGKQLPRP